MYAFHVRFILERVGEDDKLLKEIREQLDVHRVRTGLSSPVLSFTPKSHTNSTHDLSDYYAQAERLIDAERRVLRDRERHVRRAQELIALAPEHMQEVLSEYYIGGFSYRDIAAHSTRSESAIRGIIYRGIRKIAEATEGKTAA